MEPSKLKIIFRKMFICRSVKPTRAVYLAAWLSPSLCLSLIPSAEVFPPVTVLQLFTAGPDVLKSLLKFCILPVAANIMQLRCSQIAINDKINLWIILSTGVWRIVPDFYLTLLKSKEKNH